MFVHFIIFGLLVNQILANYYCDKDLCDGLGTHIGCNNDGSLYPTCPNDAEMVDLSQYKDALVDKHNEYRNKVALGQENSYQSVAKMATMTWDGELATLAELNVKTCEFEHDKCRSTKKYKYAGQNLARWSRAQNDKETGIVEALEMWYNEHKLCNDQVLTSNNFIHCGHFSAMITNENVQVGCGVIRWKEGIWMQYTMACDYAFANLVGHIYEAGPTASKCKTGTNPKYPGLCSVNEIFSMSPY